MKRSAKLKLFSIAGSVVLALSGAGVVFSPAAQAATESICAAPGNSYCWSQPNTGNAIVLTDTTNIASFTPESCEEIPAIGTEACKLVAVDGACVRAQYSLSKPLILDGCGGASEYSEYWFRVAYPGCGYDYWENAGYSIFAGENMIAEAAPVSQGKNIYMGDSYGSCSDSGSDANLWIWG